MNVTLTTTTTKKLSRKEVFAKAWQISRSSDLLFKDALKQAWSEANGIISKSFSTDADDEDVAHVLYSAVTDDNKVNEDLIRNHDRHLIRHELDWVAYHIRRMGYSVSYTKDNTYTTEYDNVPTFAI